MNATLRNVPQQAATLAGPAASQTLQSTVFDLERQLAKAMARRDFMKSQLDRSSLTASSTEAQRYQHNQLADNVTTLDLDVRQLQAELSKVRAQMAQVDAAAKQGNAPALAGTPGTSVPPRSQSMGENETMIAGVFTVFVLGPLAIAFAIRLIRRGGSSSNPREVTEMADRVRRIENAVETMAVEVERVSEGQRYLARTLGEQPAKPLPAPAGFESKRS